MKARKKMIYTSNGMEYKVSSHSYDNSIELIRFITEEGLSGEEVLNLLLDWLGLARNIIDLRSDDGKFVPL